MRVEENLRVAEFAARVGYTVATVRKKVFLRELDHFKVGRIVLIPEREVARLLSDFRPRVKIQDGGGAPK